MTEKPAYIVVCGEVRRVDADKVANATNICEQCGASFLHSPCCARYKAMTSILKAKDSILTQLRADNAVLAAEVEAWRALIGPQLVGVLPGPLLVPPLLMQVTHTRHATDASGALARAKEIK